MGELVSVPNIYIASANERGGFNVQRHTETIPPTDRRLITPELLLADNDSPEAQGRMGRWYVNFLNGKLTLLIRCSDAKIENPDPEGTMTLDAVAATEDFANYARMIQEAPFQNVAVLGHYDFELLMENGLPDGCGGHGRKRQITNGDIPLKKGISARVNNLISDDPVLQVIRNAQNLGELTTKPVAAMVQDTRTGKNSVVGVYWSDGNVIHSSVAKDVAKLRDGILTPKEVYKNGRIPFLSGDDLDGFYALLKKGEEKASLHRNDPAHYKSQGVQNPEAVVLSDNFQPLEVRFPDIFGKPNSAFRLLIPRRRTNERQSINSLRVVLDHAEYPFSKAVENYGTDGDFSDTRVLFIETKSMKSSRFLAKHISETKFGQAFLALPGRQIIVGETTSGKLTAAQIFNTSKLAA